MSAKLQKDLTVGSVPMQLVKYSLPLLAANLLQVLYAIADMIIVGWFTGQDGIAAVNLGSMVTMVMTSLVIGFSIGGTILISQFMGAKRQDDVRETISTLLTFFFFAGVAMTALGLVIASPILSLINTPAEAFDETLSYLVITMSGVIFIFGYNAVSAVLRGVGDSIRPLMFVLIASILHVGLDLIFVGVFGWGVSGSACSTVISQGVSFILSVIYLKMKNFTFDFKISSFKIIRDKLRLILKIGMPSAIQMTMVTFSFLAFMSFINGYGVEASAAAGIGMKIDGFASLPCIALAASIAPMAGQNIGAGRYDRVLHVFFTGLAMSIFFATVVTVLVNLFPSQLIACFSLDPSPLVVEYGTLYLRYVSISYILLGIMFPMNGLSNGSGNTMFTLINMLISSIVIRFALIILFTQGFNLGLDGIFLAFGVSPIVSVIIGAVFIISGRWKKSNLGISVSSENDTKSEQQI